MEKILLPIIFILITSILFWFIVVNSIKSPENNATCNIEETGPEESVCGLNN